MPDPATTTTPVFFFGPLRDPALRRIVLGAEFPVATARLNGRTAFTGAQDAGPILALGPGVVEGVLVELPPVAHARVAYYAELSGSVPQQVSVEVDGKGDRAAELWHKPASADHTGTRWDLAAWQAAHGALARAAAHDVMGLIDIQPAPETIRCLPMIHARAQARVNAEASPAPATLRYPADESAVTVLAKRRPYANFFSVEEYDLNHSLFDGGRSQDLTRAVFISADAVTVLPYDPSRDCILLIEQFRPGPLARGDRNPWSLEAIAGRIDGGETPEATALREAQEEAGITLSRLIRLAGYYPSPGAKAEFLHTYLGLADLPHNAAGLGGLADENEDIRSHVVPVDAALGLISTGEINNGPLILSLLELDRMRADLRAGRVPAA
ncbi:MAG: NUDIX domain-containing protein [Pseudomonadota bacterium]